MSTSPLPSPIPKDLKPHKRRTKFMIAQENKQILDYICKGYSHAEIRRMVNLQEKNYWKRIAAIRKLDLQITKAEQTPEAHAFLYKRTEEKLHHLEVMAMEIVESKSVQAKDKLVAMEFLRQLYEDEYSLFLYGPSQFLVKEPGAGTGNDNGGDKKRFPWQRFWDRKNADTADPMADPDSNAVF